MTEPQNTASPATPPQWQTLQVATCNTLNLAAPGHVYYDNAEPYDAAEYERKTTWLGEQVARLGADVLGLQEVWDESALRDVVARSGLC
jgi:predicted extracellular nuclease